MFFQEKAVRRHDDIIENHRKSSLFTSSMMSSMALTMSSMTFSGAEHVIDDVIDGPDDVINDIFGAGKCHR